MADKKNLHLHYRTGNIQVDVIYSKPFGRYQGIRIENLIKISLLIFLFLLDSDVLVQHGRGGAVRGVRPGLQGAGPAAESSHGVPRVGQAARVPHVRQALPQIKLPARASEAPPGAGHLRLSHVREAVLLAEQAEGAHPHAHRRGKVRLGRLSP
jgi:hypothetical protein